MRVIAGALRGRILRAPAGRATRPTPSRVREALFSVLGPLEGVRVLDLYAGSGALGIEALSRGASYAVLVERARPALAALRSNLRALGLQSQALVVATDVSQAGAALQRSGPFDLILVDPPYADVPLGRLGSALDRLLSGPELLGPDVRLVLEHAAQDESPRLRRWSPVQTRTYGDTAIALYEHRGSL